MLIFLIREQDFTEFLQYDLATLNELNIDKNRKNQDIVKSRSGNNLLDICKANNLFIVNGRIGDDKSCSCSFISKSIKSGSSAVLLLKSPNKEMYL
jgi:hypothetical protein